MKRAREPNWAEIDRLVTAAGLVDLTEICKLLRIPREQWSQIKPLHTLLATIGAAVLATQLRRTPHYTSWMAAVLEASERLQVNAQSVDRTLQLWKGDKLSGDKSATVLSLPARKSNA